jgi:hypothetical protein
MTASDYVRYLLHWHRGEHTRKGDRDPRKLAAEGMMMKADRAASDAHRSAAAANPSDKTTVKPRHR